MEETGSIGHWGRVPHAPQPRVGAAGTQFIYRVCANGVEERREVKSRLEILDAQFPAPPPPIECGLLPVILGQSKVVLTGGVCSLCDQVRSYSLAPQQDGGDTPLGQGLHGCQQLVFGPRLCSAAPWELPWQGKLGGPVGSVFPFSAAVQA